MRKAILLALSLIAIITPVITNGQDSQTKDTEWTIKPVETQAVNPSDSIDVLREVRVGAHQGYDRVVFEFNGKSLPKCKVSYTKPPFHLDESDEIVKVTGKSFLEVNFTPAYAHDMESGQLTFKSPDKLPPLPVLRDTQLIYDHEGQVIFVLGLGAQKQFRAQTLTNPSRLVVDVKH